LRKRKVFCNDGVMNIIMNTKRIVSINDIGEFLQGTKKIKIKTVSRSEKYRFISDTLIKLKYKQLNRPGKTLTKKYLRKITGYSPRQIKRLISKWRRGKLLASLEKIKSNRHKFPCKYGPIEIGLLAKADKALNYPNGRALKESLVREYEVFKKKEFETISKISVSHIYNIRNSNSQYQSTAMRYTKTNPAIVPIGERRRPDNQGKPGYLRIDSVHQGDFNGVKGVYHINVVDEVTQWELVGCVEVISEKFLIPLLEELLSQFPFRIINFHSDNGSEYINYQVAEMLNKLMIKQTKSRSRKTNDQALVEGKNGSVIRKHIGRNHIPKKYADAVNKFYQEHFNVFLNYHRVCSFATDYVDKRGKIKKKYDIYLTPYDRLKSLEKAESYLREDISFEGLDKIAYAESDIKFGEKMKREKDKLFKK